MGIEISSIGQVTNTNAHRIFGMHIVYVLDSHSPNASWAGFSAASLLQRLKTRGTGKVLPNF